MAETDILSVPATAGIYFVYSVCDSLRVHGTLAEAGGEKENTEKGEDKYGKQQQ